jgi:hypothetical protein
MANFPVKVFTHDNARVHWRENYKSGPLAEKSLGHPKGVYFGFAPSVAGNIITLIPDPVRNASALKVASRVHPAGVDIATPDPVVVDFTGVLLADLPAYLFATADYDRDAETSGQLEARTIPVVTGELVTTTDFTPEPLDLSAFSLASTPIRPTTLVINVDTVGFGPDTITDDGRGNLVGANTLSAAGTVDYATGALTGVTTSLNGGTPVTADYSQGLLPTECLIGVVDGTPGALTIDILAPLARDEPIARNSVPYGYMPAGSVETLADAVNAVNEVIASRVDLDGETQDSLSDRLAKDLGAAEMASRLGSVVRILRSNDHVANASTDEVNVSGSLSEVNRDHNPKISLGGEGSETQLGAITTGERNHCVVVDADTRSRLVDPDTRESVFGKLEGPDDQVIAGTGITFTQAGVNVVGESTSFNTIFEIGDLIEGADGLYYEVALVVDASNLVLKDAYLGDTVTTTGLNRRRFTLKLLIHVADVETPYEPPVAQNLRFFFPAFVDLSGSSFDSALFMRAPGDRPPLPEASTTVAGKIKLGEATGLVGSINIQEDGSDLGKFNILDFAAGAGQVNETSPGVVLVGEIGPTGAVGPNGPSGGAGPPGPQGPSFDAFNVWAPDSLVTIVLPPGGITITHTVDMGHEVRAIYGWWPFLSAQTSTQWETLDEVEITNISATGTMGTVEMSATATTRVEVILYLSSAGSA